MDELIAFVTARLDERYAAATDEALGPWMVRETRREVEAMRELLAEYDKDGDGMRTPDYWAGLQFAIQAAGAAWSGHPDYRQEWAPVPAGPAYR